MGTDEEAIRRVIEAFERSDWSEIDVRVGSVRVHLRTAGASSTGVAASSATAPSSAQSAGTSQHEEDGLPGGPGRGARPTSADRPTIAPPPAVELLDVEPADVAADAVLVRSPSPGIFWRSPQPGAPPFAEVGRKVSADSTLCIVEVMKLMNHVKGGIAGTVLAVFGRDGVAVAKDEPLFAIAIAADDSPHDADPPGFSAAGSSGPPGDGPVVVAGPST